ncbi:FAD-dependent oxidoreductase [Candidatus Laterigemmans baculatus]|uniref:FAD-dependent oxidoreductase n=1 Tax=Candidatus Laterigemmans baculatus TaxID=2770505 RepID=UPI0013DB4226|nr:FAD-dependent oxidoreductase [Candidatus Laterigemmans baculatus]
MRRREFVRWAGLSVPAILQGGLLSGMLRGQEARLPSELTADVIVIGGGLGGCAAALAALRAGNRVVLTEETDWLGGQLSAQAVPPDEHPWIESFGATRSYQALRQGIRDYYREHYPLTAEARAQAHLNPGGGSVSRLCHEPRVAVAVLYEMFASYLGSGQLLILLDHRPVAAEVEGDRVRSVTCRSLRDGGQITLAGPYFVDATEMGDLLPLTECEYVTGFESQSETGEPHAPSEAQPANMQACTWCFPMEYVAGEEFTIAKPEQYDFWKDFVPELDPPWPGKLFDFTYSHPATLKPRTLAFDPAKEASGWWLYRRIANKANFTEGSYPGSISLVNWPQNDYLLGNLFEVSDEEAARHREGARQLSLSLLYWLQTDAPRPDGGTGWPGLRLRPGLVDTSDGLAKYPYIRESRRIRALETVVEQHLSTDYRMEETGLSREEVTAVDYRDSVGIGSYRIDLHPSTGGDNYIDLSSLPFQIPLGALIPRRLTNLLAGNKNLGVTHITNGCYRLHPVEWNIGEAAGAVAAYALRVGETPAAIRENGSRLSQFQRQLRSDGVETAWPRARPR